MRKIDLSSFLKLNLKNFQKTKINNSEILDCRLYEREKNTVKVEFPLSFELLKQKDYINFFFKNKEIYKKKLQYKNYKKFKKNSSKLYSKQILGSEMFYFVQQSIIGKKNPFVLDLCSGNGENEEIFYDLGAEGVVLTDYNSDKVHLLTDVHNMPFKDKCFDIVFTTQAIEHWYNPFLAFKEISRVLKNDGILIASSSFMERWHGNSFFHCSPHALYTLCGINNLHISNFWVTNSGCYDLLRVGSIYKNKLIINFLEYFSNFIYRLLKKDDTLFKAKLISSKSFCFTANKKNYSIINSSNKLNDYDRTTKL